MPTLREIHTDLAHDTVLLLWMILFIEAPYKRRNFWRYQAYLAAVTVSAAFYWTSAHILTFWPACGLSYLGMRLFFGLARYTPFAKPELFE